MNIRLYEDDAKNQLIMLIDNEMEVIKKRITVSFTDTKDDIRGYDGSVAKYSSKLQKSFEYIRDNFDTIERFEYYAFSLYRVIDNNDIPTFADIMNNHDIDFFYYRLADSSVVYLKEELSDEMYTILSLSLKNFR